MADVRFDFSTEHDCKRQDVAIMDHITGSEPPLRPMVNRVCLTCLTHWYGDADRAVVEMPRRVWDRWMGAA